MSFSCGKILQMAYFFLYETYLLLVSKDKMLTCPTLKNWRLPIIGEFNGRNYFHEGREKKIWGGGGVDEKMVLINYLLQNQGMKR